MPAYYLDSSALVKRYLRESGSKWMVSLTDALSSQGFFSAELVMVEVVAALGRAQRDGRISTGQRDRIVARFLDEFQGILEVMPVSSRVLRLANHLALRRALRAYDAVHLATALDVVGDLSQAGLPSPIFVSADGQLLEAARAEGLAAINPAEHARDRA